MGQASLAFEPPTPTAHSSAFSLRDYQEAALAGVREKLAAHRSTLAVLATGLGKTVLAGHAAIEAGGRVLFLAHLDTLVSQSRKALQSITGEDWELEQGGWRAKANGRRHVVASVQSLMRPKRLWRFRPDAFALVIVDEVHHYVSPSFRRPIDWFTGAKILGITATPDRGDGKALGRLFQSEAYRMDIGDGVEGGWLTGIDCAPAIKLDTNLDGVKVTAGELVMSQVDEKIAKVIRPVVEGGIARAGDMRTVVFCPGVRTAHAAAELFNSRKPGSARAIDGTMDRDLRRSIIADHKEGRFQFLVNCGILIEGYDDERLTCIIDATPTKSRARFAQKVGRVTRLWPGIGALSSREERLAAIAASPKPRAIVIDLAFNSDRHDLACPLDLLGGKYTDAERKRAKKILQEEGGDPRSALERARQEEERRKLIAAAAAKAKADVQLGASRDLTARRRRKRLKLVPPPSAPAAPQPASEKQLWRLRKFGVDAQPGMTKAEATKLLNYEFKAEAMGWCRPDQRAWLTKHIGVSGRGMSKETFRRIALAYVANGRQPLSKAQYEAALANAEPGSAG